MDFNKSLHIWRRWWIVTIMLLLLALVGISAMLTGMRTYQSSSSVVLLASRSAARPNGGNPYLSFSPSLTLTADAVSREVMAPGTLQELTAQGFLPSYTVALAPYTTNTTGSVLLVTVTGKDMIAVERTLHAVTSEVSAKLLQLQSQNRVKPHDRVRAATLSYTPQATLSVSQTARPVVAAAALGLLLALGFPVVADGAFARRRLRRKAAVLPRNGPDPAGPLAPGQPEPDRLQSGVGRQPTRASYPR
jgi:hypothetical protein